MSTWQSIFEIAEKVQSGQESAVKLVEKSLSLINDNKKLKQEKNSSLISKNDYYFNNVKLVISSGSTAAIFEYLYFKKKVFIYMTKTRQNIHIIMEMKIQKIF